MVQLVVLLEEIGEGGLVVERPLPVEYLRSVLSGDGPDTGFSPVGAGRVKASLEKVSGAGILLSGEARVEVLGPCKRCLADTRLEVVPKFQLDLVRRRAPDPEDQEKDEAPEAEKAGSFETGATEEETFDGHEIDLGAILREQILLALPMDALCKESCKGLCTVCGKDLNEGECGCVRKAPDPRFAKLKDLKVP